MFGSGVVFLICCCGDTCRQAIVVVLVARSGVNKSGEQTNGCAEAEGVTFIRDPHSYDRSRLACTCSNESVKGGRGNTRKFAWLAAARALRIHVYVKYERVSCVNPQVGLIIKGPAAVTATVCDGSRRGTGQGGSCCSRGGKSKRLEQLAWGWAGLGSREGRRTLGGRQAWQGLVKASAG